MTLVSMGSRYGIQPIIYAFNCDHSEYTCMQGDHKICDHRISCVCVCGGGGGGGGCFDSLFIVRLVLEVVA